MKYVNVWCKEVPHEVRTSEDGKIEIWKDSGIETTQKMEHNRSDVNLLDHAARRGTTM